MFLKRRWGKNSKAWLLYRQYRFSFIVFSPNLWYWVNLPGAFFCFGGVLWRKDLTCLHWTSHHFHVLCAVTLASRCGVLVAFPSFLLQFCPWSVCLTFETWPCAQTLSSSVCCKSVPQLRDALSQQHDCLHESICCPVLILGTQRRVGFETAVRNATVDSSFEFESASVLCIYICIYRLTL